jgi:hypothetical protein
MSANGAPQKIKDDTPAGFKRILHLQKLQAKKPKTKRQLPKKHANESIRDYEHRLDQEAREKLVKIAKSSSRKVEKRKEYKKKKKVQLLEKKSEKEEERREDEPFREKFKFGEVTQAPPNIKVIPKDREQERRKKLQEFIAKRPELEGEEVVETKSFRKVKLKHLPTSQRLNLEAERKKVIESYRQNKKQKPGPGSGETLDSQ